MRKMILSLLSATCLLLALSSVPAQAGCLPILETTRYGTVNGQVCLSSASVSFNGTITTAAGQSYRVVANGCVTGTAPDLAVSGTATVSQGDTVLETVTVSATGSNLLTAAAGFINKTITLAPQH